MKSEGVVFTGFNPRGVIALLREMTRSGVPFSIVACSDRDPILRSSYAASIKVVRKSPDLSLPEVASILQVVQRRSGADKLVLFPTTEYLNRFLLNHRHALETDQLLIPLPEQSLYERVSDKEQFGRTCAEAGLPIPRTLTPQHVTDYPVVAKPARYFARSGQAQGKPRLIFTESELKTFIQSANSGDYFLQEFVPGNSYYLLYYIPRTGASVRFSQQNVAQQKNGGSIVAAKPAKLHKHLIADRYESVLRNLGYSGLVMIEVRERHNGEYCMIEANPRLWGPSQLVVDSGVPMLRRYLGDLGFVISENTARAACSDVLYFWMGGTGGCQRASATLDFHGCSPFDFLDEIPSYLKYDVYLRPDTMHVFYDEIRS